MKAYAGIGSRSTPKDVLDLMAALGAKLADEHWVLRSGGAEGADSAFLRGVTELSKPGAWNDNRLYAQIFLPWASFGQGLRWEGVKHYDSPAAWTNEFVDAFHPAPERLSPAARKLMARNTHQIYGLDHHDCTQYSKFIICWTPEASGSGGTGQALRMAHAAKIPVYDLADPDVRTRLEAWLT